MIFKKNEGFTLVEVIVALAVVAIVSTSLFRMFVTTSYVNRDAQLTDLANIIAVGQAETFTIDPESYPSTTMYFDNRGTLLYNPESGGIPTGALIEVKSTVTKPSNVSGNSTGYFPNFAGSIVLSSDIDWDIEISPANVIRVGGHGMTLADLAGQNNSNLKNNILPIKVVDTGGKANRKLYIKNESTVEAAIYFFQSDLSQSIELIPVSGRTSITNVHPTSSSNTKYNLELEVSKLVGNISKFMFTFSTDQYVYH